MRNSFIQLIAIAFLLTVLAGLGQPQITSVIALSTTLNRYLVKVDGSHIAQVQVPTKVMTQIKGGSTDVFI